MYTCIRRKIWSYLSRNSNKIKTSHSQNFLFLNKKQITSKGSDLPKKEWVAVHLRELSTFIDIKIPTTTVLSIYYMAVSQKDWKQPNRRIWLAKIDIDRGLDFPI